MIRKRGWPAVAVASLAGSMAAPTDLWTLRGTRPNGAFGSVATLDDLDGDGVQETAVGETGDFNRFSSEPGRVDVDSGLDRALRYEFVVDPPGDCCGLAVANSGDVNGDGVSDLAVGAMQWIDWKTTGSATCASSPAPMAA